MKLFLYLLFTICISTSFAQNKNQFYALDSQMNQTVLDSSRYILWIHLKEDSNWQWDYYRTWGPLIKSVSYADHDGTILNGRSFFIHPSAIWIQPEILTTVKKTMDLQNSEVLRLIVL